MNEEERMLAGARRLDKATLTEIYDLYGAELHRYAARLLGNSDLAEECVSETFSRFLDAIHHQHGPRQNLRAYLYRVAHNWITDSFRRRPPPALALDEVLLSSNDPGPEAVATQNLQRARVREALQQLTPDQRMVVSLKFLEGWKNEEVAQALGKPVGAVKSLQHRALEALRRMLLQKKEEQS